MTRIEKDQIIPYMFPLRQNLLVQVTLPADLTRVEAERVIRFVNSIAFDSDELPEWERDLLMNESGRTTLSNLIERWLTDYAEETT